MLLKIDFEKAYDKIKWSFLFQMLKMKGFPDKWIDWVMETVRGGKVCVKVNENLGKYFITHKGLRQGDSLSPLNFDLAADALAIMLDKARENGLVKGVLNEYIPNGVNMLQNADDTILVAKADHK